ncbi:MAG: nucleotidyl transferase AbiEii/AbiGii toxin family protein [Verrucomicrobia bacterium]|nr:nucleotidyl transferase AbiEii/AbiGii toxin family protein [Verrucomicrobiota bacterium]
MREPARARDNGVAVASKLDLAATKARVVVERAERKDYLDLAALLKSGISLTDALGAARALYGEQFNPMITLKALSYFADGDLPKLSDGVKQFLSASQRSADDSSDPSVIGPNRAAEFLMPRGGFSRKRSQRGEAAAEVVTALKRYSVTRLNR